jgi:general secretion pathway protein A
MYERHFGFSVKPFALTPDPAFLYPSQQHSMGLSALEYGLESEAAFSVLSGEIGSGKTTLVRRLLRQLGERVAVGLISHTHRRFRSIHHWVLSALGVVPDGDSEIAVYEALANSFVSEYAKGRRSLLIFDEAQNLSIEVLEQLRLLSNLNSEKDLVLQILLVGQPELRAKLSHPELKQLAQRVSVHFHLNALERHETHAYIRHRLQVAGGNPCLFLPEAVELVHARTKGVPRLLNQLCDYALVYGFANRQTEIDADLIAQVVRDCRSGLALPTVSTAGARVPLGMTNGSAA